MEKSRAAWASVKTADGILVPGGFGNRGVEGKIAAANYARTHKKPYLGICLGMQVAVIEFARNVLGKEDANSTEFEPQCRQPAIIFMPEGSTTHMGGTMRLGVRATLLQAADSHAGNLYHPLEANIIMERHRHRYAGFGGFGGKRMHALSGSDRERSTAEPRVTSW